MKSESEINVAGDIRARILSMIIGAELKPGVRIVEDELCEKIGVGRTPLREALLVLQGEGYVERKRGWIVGEVNNDQISAIFESRAAIEGATARLAARYADDSTFAELKDLIEKMDRIDLLSRRDLNELNSSFHQKIVDAARNPFLADFHKRTRFQYWLLRVPVLFTEVEAKRTNDQHRMILDCLINRDEKGAEEAARDHVETTRSIVEPAIRF
ncbi:GntR family transcriptional regulator [Bartonella sp. HY329]|uniref:GntR family transcriptional regulator n=1 Tax=unclassified Bartonella TaxID=2645622 RepID=UPI0021CADD55|nr:MULTISPECIES: GntR family transcriptional regulator [unclassified Bartonella]UXM96082.1 GntR family transcriptional regulator [Bartonella sp. HY329]UXN10406.1 GntR family transcriptional regulator [Bartonella sp. HY328]